jgi:uncharacterized protein YcaQ
MNSTELSLPELRRIAVRAQLLDGSATSVLDTVRRLGFLQLDPIATVATAQHMVLYSRLGNYDTAELDRLLRERALFEYDAFIYPVEDLPLVRARMKRWRSGGLTPAREKFVRQFLDEHKDFKKHVLKELERNGPMLSRDLRHDLMPLGDGHRWWGDRQVRLMLDILAARGEIAVAGRAGKLRLWDLPERVFPASETLPWPEAERELEERRRRSLGVWLERGQLHVHPDAPPPDPVPNRVTFLSPFDRLIHDRNRAEALFGFHYRLEMYVPRDKRQYGYYVLPLLRGDRVAGRIDDEHIRTERLLRVNGAWWEKGEKPAPLGKALRSLATFVGADTIEP